MIDKAVIFVDFPRSAWACDCSSGRHWLHRCSCGGCEHATLAKRRSSIRRIVRCQAKGGTRLRGFLETHRGPKSSSTEAATDRPSTRLPFRTRFSLEATLKNNRPTRLAWCIFFIGTGFFVLCDLKGAYNLGFSPIQTASSQGRYAHLCISLES